MMFNLEYILLFWRLLLLYELLFELSVFISSIKRDFIKVSKLKIFLSKIYKNNSVALSNFPNFFNSEPSPIVSFILLIMFLFIKFFNLLSFIIFSLLDILSINFSIKSETGFKNKVFLSSNIKPISSINS